MNASHNAPSSLDCILAFDANNRLIVSHRGQALGLPFTGESLAQALERLEAAYPSHTLPILAFEAEAGKLTYRAHLLQVEGPCLDDTVRPVPIGDLEIEGAPVHPALRLVLSRLDPHLIDIPYLHLGESDFIYKFRPQKERNAAIYAQDDVASTLYHSQLCAAIKAKARQHERSATGPVDLNFGAVTYVIPSHFGFCLGVKNAIERAYETLVENPGRRVFMLSELIHNPFVNEDLLRRGLRYLQTDKGIAYREDGTTALAAGDSPLLWDTLRPEDIVIIPAFGATDDDKRRLVKKGIAVFQYDATCMLVEKVWKAARSYGREGYTVVIHGKHEHEETKATFSNTRRYAEAVIVRNLEESRLLGEIIASNDPAYRRRFYDIFSGKHTPGFDVERHLERVAVVNQTTLLMNETREIIAPLTQVVEERVGPDPKGALARVGCHGRHDTLCYATQVNQDALSKALDQPLDAAFVIGGKNSSNTYQLYRLCEQRLGERAFFIQSEANIASLSQVEHFVFPAKGHAGHGGAVENRVLWEKATGPRRVLITGGASCPDGIIQQVIARINSFFPAAELRGVESVLADLA